MSPEETETLKRGLERAGLVNPTVSDYQEKEGERTIKVTDGDGKEYLAYIDQTFYVYAVKECGDDGKYIYMEVDD